MRSVVRQQGLCSPCAPATATTPRAVFWIAWAACNRDRRPASEQFPRGEPVPGRVLLINVNQCDTPYPVYPLGLSHVAAALTQAGHDVRLFDMGIEGHRLAQVVDSFAPSLVGVSLRNIDDVDIEKQRFFVPDLVEVVRRVKQLVDVPVVVGGSAFSLFPEQLLEMSGADFGVRGEGERAARALVDALESGSTVESIPGLVYHRNGTVVSNAADETRALEASPALRPHGLVEHYLSRSSMLNVQSQRGCAYHCCYCTYPLIEGQRFRYRDPRAVVDEIEQATQLGATYFFMVDSVFNTSREHVLGLCDELIRRDLRVGWCCFLRPAGLDEELMGAMARAGLRHIEYGSDSFCDSVLQAYGKGFAFDDILRSSELARAHKVRYAHFLIAGGPSETEQTLHEGFRNSQRLRRTVIFPY
ncbi:MAG: radical SAM protein, partial [Chitinivibrionales bacterium]|nr:radical SAM protein [Chitinivibrionales bacterium]